MRSTHDVRTLSTDLLSPPGGGARKTQLRWWRAPPRKCLFTKPTSQRSQRAVRSFRSLRRDDCLHALSLLFAAAPHATSTQQHAASATRNAAPHV
jgi:hypothetical protein